MLPNVINKWDLDQYKQYFLILIMLSKMGPMLDFWSSSAPFY